MENQMSLGPHLTGDQLSDLAEGIAIPEEKIQCDLHLNQCEQCERELSILKIYFTEMNLLPTTPAPANFLSNVRARIDKPLTWKKLLNQLWGLRKWVPAQIALLTVLGISIITTYLYEGRGNLSATRVYEPVAEAKSNRERLEPNRPVLKSPPQAVPSLSRASNIVQKGKRGDESFEPGDLAKKSDGKLVAKEEIEVKDKAKMAAPEAATPEAAVTEALAPREMSVARSSGVLNQTVDLILHLKKGKDLKVFLTQSEGLGIFVVENSPTKLKSEKSKSSVYSSLGYEFTVPLEKSKAWIELLGEYGQLDSNPSLSAPKTTIQLKIIQP